MRAASTACTVAGTCVLSSGLRQPVGAALAGQHAGLHQRPDALLEEERVALGPLDQQALERLRAPASSPSSACEQLLGALAAAAGRAGAAGSRSCGARRARTRAGSSPAAGCGRSAGSPPGCRAAPGSRRRSSAGPRTPAAAAAPGSRAAAGACSASRVRWRRCGGSSASQAASSTGTSSSASNGGQGRLQRRVERQQLAGQLLADAPRVVARPRCRSSS